MSLVDKLLGQRIANVEVLQSQVVTVTQPEGRSTMIVVVAIVTQTRIRSIHVLVGLYAQQLCRFTVYPAVFKQSLEDVSPLALAESINVLAID